jgi:geranylgeranyl diphosphate synthase, type I
MQFSQLTRWVPRIERGLAGAYARESRASPEFAPWTKILEEFALRGGKRFRALLVLGGFVLAAHRAPGPALPAAVGLEHFQAWMLIHDDIIDHAEVRRGGPTVHRELECEHARGGLQGSAAAYGTGMGITLGDLQEPYTVASFLAARVRSDRRLLALAEYARMARDTAYGQLLDIRGGMRPIGELTEREVLEVHRLKTSVYTVVSPLRIGAILGGGRSGLLADLESIGTDLGIAFQLRDDVLGAGFDSGEAGKSANDLVEGKRTLLVVRAWASGDAEARQCLQSVLGNASARPSEIDRAREVIRSTGSLAHSEARIDALTKRAMARIAGSRNLRPADRNLLREIGERLVHRSK